MDETEIGSSTAGFLARIRSDLAASRRRRIGGLAVGRGLITPAQLEEALRETAGPIEETLVARGWLRPSQADTLREELDGPATAPPDTSVPRYEIGGKLGEGAVSEVYRGTDRELGRPVALKFLREAYLAQERVRERFHREAQSLARMDHPHVVKVHDVGRRDGRLFLVMELVEGEPFGHRLKREPRASRAAVALLEQAARGVQHAHEKGIVHRDLKPDNILVSASGVAKVADFGLAHLGESGPALTHAGTVLGTPMYMAPEQVRARGEVTARTDVYALGAILYQVIAGRPPHSAESVSEIYDKILRDDPEPPRKIDPAVPWELEAVALKALDKDPARRYGSAGEFAEELRRFLAGEPVEARPVSTLVRAARRLVRNRVLAAAILAVLVLGAVAWLQSRSLRGEALALKSAGNLLEAARGHLEKAKDALYDERIEIAALEASVAAARDLVEQALARAGDLPLAHSRMGEVWEYLGHFGKAEASFRKAAALDPDSGPTRFRLGRLLLWRAYLASLNMWTVPDPAEAAAAEAIAREGAREIEVAQTAGSGFDDALRRAIAGAMLAHLRGDAAETQRLCAEGIRSFGRREGVEELHWLDGLSRRKRADRIPSYDAALAIRPRFPLALYSRAWASDRAYADFEAAIRCAPGFAEAYIFRGSEHLVRNNLDLARADFDRLIGWGLHLAPAFNGRAAARLRLKDFDGAIADATEAIRHKPAGYHIPWMYRAEARLAKGLHDEAIADATRALDIVAGREGMDTPYAIRGRARAAKGDRAGAIEDLRKAGTAGASYLRELERP